MSCRQVHTSYCVSNRAPMQVKLEISKTVLFNNNIVSVKIKGEVNSAFSQLQKLTTLQDQCIVLD